MSKLIFRSISVPHGSTSPGHGHWGRAGGGHKRESSLSSTDKKSRDTRDDNVMCFGVGRNSPLWGGEKHGGGQRVTAGS